MSENRLTGGNRPVTSLRAPAPPRPAGTTRRGGYDPGFFALDRSAWETLKERHGNRLAYYYHDLAASCSYKTPNRFEHGRVSELAEHLKESVGTTRRVLTQLEAAGLIRWTRAKNQNDGEVVLLAQIERPKPARETLDVLPTPQADLTADPFTSEADLTPDPFAPAVENTDEVSLGAASGAASGAADLHRPLLGKRDIQLTNNNPSSFRETLSRGDDLGRGLIEREDQQSGVIQRAAQIVAKARESVHGKPAGTGAIRKLADAIAAEQSDVIAGWLAEGCNPERIAQAVAERHRTKNDHIAGNQYATPYDLGSLDERRRLAADACYLCDDGWIYFEEQRASLLCECQKLETGVR
jgi:DNA-binding MarR family transcriptional regulator